VLEPAREAFVHGLHVAATVSGALVVAAALLVVSLLRGERRQRASARILCPAEGMAPAR
jgi:hypothetical protein